MRPSLAAAVVVLASCQASEPLPRVYGSGPIEVSLVHLLADPGRYDGREVVVVGFCRLEFDGNALYLHREDFEQSIVKNAVWLDLDSPIPQTYRDLSDKYVIVEATFNARDKGHEGLFSGELRAIRRMDANMARADIERLRQRVPKKQ